MTLELAEAADAAIQGFQDRRRSRQDMVSQLECLVDLADERGLLGAGDARRMWGQLEIVNALNEGPEIGEDARQEMLQIAKELSALLRILETS